MSQALSFHGSPFISKLPAAQNAVDLFDAWASRFPAKTGLVSSGHAGLYEDERIDWMNQQLSLINGWG